MAELKRNGRTEKKTWIYQKKKNAKGGMPLAKKNTKRYIFFKIMISNLSRN